MEGKVGPPHKADNLTTICEPTVWIKCGSLDISILWAFTDCYRGYRVPENESVPVIKIERGESTRLGWTPYKELYTITHNRMHTIKIIGMMLRHRQ
jgi:hypothetical protein